MPRFSLRVLIVIVALCAAVGGAFAYFNRSPLVKLFGGVRNMEIVGNPTRVEAYRLGDPPGGLPLKDYVSPLDYPTVSAAIRVPPTFATAMSKSLVDDETYEWDLAKACGYPVYGVRVKFIRGADHLDVYFCFKCDDLAVVRDGKQLGSGDFHSRRVVFVRAVKRLFPDDEVIQSLRD
jgi:hypothetical protein